MTAYSIIAALNILEQQHGLMFFLVDIGLKSSLIIALAYAVQLFVPGREPATRSIVWMMAFAGLILLPTFHLMLPSLSVALSYASSLDVYSGAIQVDAIAQSLFGVAVSYLLVCALLTCYLVSGIQNVVYLSRQAKPFRHEHALRCLDRLQESNGCTRSVELLVSPSVSSPLTWGLWRHKILFPSSAHGWSEQLLEQAISHELAHVQRGDWILQVFARAALSLYWINPLVWYAHRRLLIETEKACDDVAVENSGSPLAYAQNLLQLASRFNTERKLLAPALLGIRSSLSQRIRHILQQRVNIHSSDTSHILPSLVFAAIVAAPFAALNMKLELVESTQLYQFEGVLIDVSFFPNGSEEHHMLMAEFR